jgi:hypothetical protein
MAVQIAVAVQATVAVVERLVEPVLDSPPATRGAAPVLECGNGAKVNL